MSVWWWLVSGLIVAHLIARYGPPGPPKLLHHADDLTWEEFFEYEIKRLVKASLALLSTIPHVSHWCWQGLREEVATYFQTPPCPLHVPDTLELDIVGQLRAVSLLSQAIVAWDQASPLMILLSGSVGVGKMELAQQTANRLFDAKCGNRETEFLTIQGDLADEASALSQIRQYTYQRPQGSVVILQHADAMLSRLCRELRQYSKVVVLATTHLGSKAIHNSIRQYGGDLQQVSKLELDLVVRDELDLALKEDVAQYFHAIAPFVPLGPDELQQILLKKVQRWSGERVNVNWKELRMTSALAQTLTDASKIEYLAWRKRYGPKPMTIVVTMVILS
jgi:hypothetical protein